MFRCVFAFSSPDRVNEAFVRHIFTARTNSPLIWQIGRFPVRVVGVNSHKHLSPLNDRDAEERGAEGAAAALTCEGGWGCQNNTNLLNKLIYFTFQNFNVFSISNTLPYSCGDTSLHQNT